MQRRSSNFLEVLKSRSVILTEGSVIERLKREFKYNLDPILLNSAMIYSTEGRELLTNIYSQYIESAKSAGLPIMLLTPTWRANAERIEQAGLKGKNINADAFLFMKNIRKNFKDYTDKIFIGGLTACKRDAYKPEEALSKNEAMEFHKQQIYELANTGVDFLLASTLPALSEAKGIAGVMSGTGVPYLISFVIRQNGNLLDGTPLDKAIHEIDLDVTVPPVYYLVNCVHPEIFEEAINALQKNSTIIKERIIGLQANSSRKSPEELDNLNFLDTDELDNWGLSMASLNKNLNMKILGGCCGTDNNYINCLIKYLNIELS